MHCQRNMILPEGHSSLLNFTATSSRLFRIKLTRPLLTILLGWYLPTCVIAAQPTGWTSGGKSVLIIPVGFTDAPAPGGPAEGWPTLMTNDNAYFVRQSYSSYWYSSYTICPPVSMGVSSTNYKPYWKWQVSAFLPDVHDKAKLAGYDTKDYDLEIVHTWIPSESKAGNASTGGKGIWINMSNGYDRISIVTSHEVGHNLGAFHSQGSSSSSYIYPSKNVNRTGYWLADYGNPFDKMGFGMSLLTDYCAYSKNAFGWLPDSMVANATTSGTYRIYAFDQGSVTAGNYYAMKIARDQANNYWFEFRQAITNNVWSMNGLHVLWGAEEVLAAAGAPELLDMTPGSTGGIYPDPVWGTGGATIFDAPLLIGRTFSDANVNLHITPIRKCGTLPESLDVVVNRGPFPGNRAPSLSIAATTLTPGTNQTVTFTATAVDPDGDALAYFWEFDDPDAPADSRIRPFGTGIPVPDSGLRIAASNTWASNGVYLARCTVTDMKGGRTTAAATVIVGTGSGLTISGTVRDAGGQPVSGAVVNNWNTNAPAVQFGSSNFVASGETSSNGQYMIHVTSNTIYRLLTRHGGHSYTCSVGGSVTGTVNVGVASVANLNFTRVPANCTIGGIVYLEGIHRTYNPLLYGSMTIHDSISGQDASIDTNGNWSMTVPEGPLALTFSNQPGHSLKYGFLNPFEVMENYVLLHVLVDVPGAVSSVGFGARYGSGDNTSRSVSIPVVLTPPLGYTNTTWPMSIWLKGEIEAAGTAQYGVDYRFPTMEVTFTNQTTVFTNFLFLNVISNAAPYSRTVVLKLIPLTSAGHVGAISNYTYAIIPPGADGDADGMPDWWEWRYANDLSGILPSADSDGDGTRNLDEYLADTEPDNTNSVLVITSLQVIPPGVQIDWKGGSNAWQYLEYRQNLIDTSETWKAICTNVPPTTLHTNLYLIESAATSRFYRVRANR